MTIEEIVQTDEVKSAMSDYRGMCFWNVADDFYPQTKAQMLMAVDCLEKYGDMRAYRLAGRIRQWL